MTTTATDTVRSIVLAALRKIGVVAYDMEPNADQTDAGVRALNRMLKAWQNRGVNLWATTAASVACTTAASYTLSPVRPLEILSCRFKRSGVELPMQSMTRAEYDRLPVKTTQGTPTMYYYDRQREAARLYVWPVLATVSGQTLEITYTREIEDMAATDVIDVPGEFYDAVVYGLAARLADDYQVADPRVQARAEDELARALAFDREGSVFFAGPYA